MMIAVLVILGLCFGSFVNALVWRIHEQDKPKKKRAANDKALSMTRGRSMCTHCKHELGVADLIPLFSWLWLRGRCRYCKHKIDDSPLVEALLPVLFVVSYVFWPYGFNVTGWVLLIIWLVLLVGLAALVVYDLRWMLLPNRIVFTLLGVAIAGSVAHVVASDAVWQALLAGLESVAIAGGIFYVLFEVSKGEWIGGGDVKLGFVIGFVLMSPGKSILMLFLSSLIGTAVVLPLLACKKVGRTSHIPFGPFLIIAAVISYLFGAEIIRWYPSFIEQMLNA